MNDGTATSPHHSTSCVSLLRAFTFCQRCSKLSVNLTSFHVPTISPFFTLKMPSRGIVLKSPVV